MDLICIRCGEPWDMDYVLHEDPGGFKRQGGRIDHCPCCPKERPKLSPEQRRWLETVGILADLLGDDIDGLAVALDDLGMP